MVIDEVANWKLEAKLEDNFRYFLQVAEVPKIESGARAYVIGRKGTGKTAIAEYLGGLSGLGTFSERLTFKNFPFNELYEFSQAGYSPANQYIVLWKYIIYSFVCRMMAGNEAIDPRARSALTKMYGKEPLASLRRTLSGWTAKSFNIGLLGFSGGLELSNNAENLSWSDRVDILEDFLQKYLDSSTYFVLFDELDEDYREITNHDQHQRYTNLLTGLFKAVQDIRSVFRSKARLFPVVFLRDDLYALLIDSDKNKWNDFKVELDWSEVELRRLLAFRLTRAAHPNAARPMPFLDAWHMLFAGETVGVGNRDRRHIPIFDYISRCTHLRPRDFVRYLQLCAEEAQSRGESHVSPEVVRYCEKAFSIHLRDELVDEVHGLLPDIGSIFDLFSQIRKQELSIEEFYGAFAAQLQAGRLISSDPDFVLRALFYFSIIGNRPRQRLVTVFRYQNRDATLNFGEKIVPHRGLFKALQIV